jgi:hypothetical protein
LESTSIIEFDCSNNYIESFLGLKFPITEASGSSTNPTESLINFDCSQNRIKSFNHLTFLPNVKLTHFNCSSNHITSFKLKDSGAGLILPETLTIFDCSNNKITSFELEDGVNLMLPNSLIDFSLKKNPILQIDSFKGGSNLKYLELSSKVKLIDPKFNSVLYRSEINVEFDPKLYTREELIFLYLNLNVRLSEEETYHKCQLIISLIEKRR